MVLGVGAGVVSNKTHGSKKEKVMEKIYSAVTSHFGHFGENLVSSGHSISNLTCPVKRKLGIFVQES